MLLLPRAVLFPGPRCRPESYSSRIHGRRQHPQPRARPPPRQPKARQKPRQRARPQRHRPQQRPRPRPQPVTTTATAGLMARITTATATTMARTTARVAARATTARGREPTAHSSCCCCVGVGYCIGEKGRGLGHINGRSQRATDNRPKAPAAAAFEGRGGNRRAKGRENGIVTKKHKNQKELNFYARRPRTTGP